MSSNQTYRERGERERDSNRSAGYRGSGDGSNRGGGSRSRGSGYRPRRYWENDEYYKEDRDRSGRRRRRSYSRSRSRSRSRSYSSGSRSRSRTPPKRGRSRSPPAKVEEYVPRTAAELGSQQTEPYVPAKDPAESWSATRMSAAQNFLPQANGQVVSSLNQMNPYGHGMMMDSSASMYGGGAQYIPSQTHHLPMMDSQNQATHPYGYGQQQSNMSLYQNQPAVEASYPQQHHRAAPSAPPLSMNQAVNIPPGLSDAKGSKEEETDSRKKKDSKRKKKKRHHSSSSSSSSSDNSSDGSRRRRKSKNNRGSSNSSSDEEDEPAEKKEKDSSQASQPGGLTAQQKESLLRQREGYQSKLEILEREIVKLRNQEDDLIRSRADRQLIDENLKLQAELKGRCKAVRIVLEKIDDVMHVGGKSAAGEKPKASAPPPPALSAGAAPPPPKLSQSEASRSSKDVSNTDAYHGEKRSGSGSTEYDYFDNGQHWCRLCNVFPNSVEQMLQHFHSKEHHDQIQQLGIDEKPWHKRKPVTESRASVGARKAPLRGMQFFSPVEGWYCRLCNHWMGDHHCAVEHLKSDEHNSNYMNFLEEHPDWERKWVSDREKALGISGSKELKDSMELSSSSSSGKQQRPSRFKDEPPAVVLKTKERIQEDTVMDSSGKSIRVQMRNSMKTEENSRGFTAQPISEQAANKDNTLDEWMTKPKVTVDIIDTQKFAAIVRQKHGAKEKEQSEKNSRAESHRQEEAKSAPAPPVISSSSSQKDRDRDSRREERRRGDKVELQISSRDKDRDRAGGGGSDRYRDRDRDSRSSRRRSRTRSRSRSRERDRRYNRRRSRSRSRSRSRDRSDRDRREKGGGDRDRPEFKETMSKKLPMIGKMPLYKRPAVIKDKSEAEEKPEPALEIPPVKVPPGITPSVTYSPKEHIARMASLFHHDNSNTPPMVSNYMYDSRTAAYAQMGVEQQHYGIPGVGVPPSTTQAMTYSASAELHQDVAVPAPAVRPDYNTEVADDTPPGVDVKEAKDENAPGGLPDDFQQALDIIYAAPGAKPPVSTSSVPQPVPPPPSDGTSSNGVAEKEPAISEYGSGEYGSNGYASYMGYQPYQQSFDGYAPYEDLDDGPPGVGDHLVSGSAIRPPPSLATNVSAGEAKAKNDVVTEDKDPPPPGDDDMDDLRMLGIDVDDTAASSVRH